MTGLEQDIAALEDDLERLKEQRHEYHRENDHSRFVLMDELVEEVEVELERMKGGK